MTALTPDQTARLEKLAEYLDTFPRFGGGPSVADDLHSALAELTTLREERDAALKECSSWARQAGEAIGRLETSEAVGIVDGWRERAEDAEAQLARTGPLVEAAREWVNAGTAHEADVKSGCVDEAVSKRIWRRWLDAEIAVHQAARAFAKSEGQPSRALEHPGRTDGERMDWLEKLCRENGDAREILDSILYHDGNLRALIDAEIAKTEGVGVRPTSSTRSSPPRRR